MLVAFYGLAASSASRKSPGADSLCKNTSPSRGQAPTRLTCAGDVRQISLDNLKFGNKIVIYIV